jgi:hypothetical protein
MEITERLTTVRLHQRYPVLMRKRSQLAPGTYPYDDFVYTHTKEGTTSHYAAAFLQ